ncbi:MAG TPA: hypothetical protein VEK79_05475 [Thermoanaerobaculia bacterium]|nr:hypothetical protein [Thermoanaerobaculia bacterium]
MKLDAVLCGVAGEYYVAAELSRRGYLASITLRNSRGVDVLATNRDATKSVAIQVKTNQRGLAEWILNEKVETMPSGADLPENLFFVFVNLPPDGEPPSYHVISRREVARIVREGHAAWLATLGRGGRPRAANNPIRKFKDAAGTYRDRWDLLGLD